jgi:transcriptional regulator with XRE-family HTH domain
MQRYKASNCFTYYLSISQAISPLFHMKTANERLAEAREALGFHSKAEFAKHVGIERSTYDKMEKGPHKPSADNLERIIEREPYLSLNWLLTGAGDMLLNKTKAAPDYKQAQPTPGLTSGAATVAEAENVLLREQVIDLRSTVEFLKAELGKFGGSLEAALHGILPTRPAGQCVGVPA